MNKTGNAHSAIGIDHAHEQNNAEVKGRGGAVGLTEDPSALRRWTIGGPEVHRLLDEFAPHCHESDMHHEQTENFQRKYICDCSALKESFLHFENPFCNESTELIKLDTRHAASSAAIDNLYSLEEKGKFLYNDFVLTRLEKGIKSVYEVIPRVESKIFTLPLKKSAKNVIRNLKEDVNLFSRMFIISTARDLNLTEFFQHENQECPPALSLNGSLRPGSKALLLPILEKLIPEPETRYLFSLIFSHFIIFIGILFFGFFLVLSRDAPTLPTCEGIIYDGAGLVHQIKPNKSVKNMLEYTDKQLKPHLISSAEKFKSERVDIAWDLYFQSSIKKARDERGNGVRQQDLPSKG